MSEASEWGVPDWLHPKDYPAPQGPGVMVKWAWEFLRRNEDFPNFWQAKVEPFITAGGRIGRNQAGKRWPYYREMQEKFGIASPWSPRQNSCIPAFSDGATPYVAAPALTYESLPDSAEPARPSGIVRASRANIGKETILEDSWLPLCWFEMGFAIDLRFPLDDQLKAIRKLAEEDQLALKKAGRINPKTARTSDRDQYVLYLRILDAESIGAERSVMEGVLFPNIDNGYDQGRPRSKAFDNARTEARRLRDSGYRALAYRAKGPILDALGP